MDAVLAGVIVVAILSIVATVTKIHERNTETVPGIDATEVSDIMSPIGEGGTETAWLAYYDAVVSLIQAKANSK